MKLLPDLAVFRDYGMVFVLVLLCGMITWATWEEQHPSDASAGTALANGLYDLKGKDKARKKVSEQRQLLSLPAHYGSLVGVTGSGQQAVLWYQDDMGVIRNVIIEADVIEPLRIDPKLTFKREADILRD